MIGTRQRLVFPIILIQQYDQTPKTASCPLAKSRNQREDMFIMYTWLSRPLSLLLLLMHNLNIVFRDLFVGLHEIVFNLSGQITLESDFFSASRNLGHTGTGGELFTKVFGDLFEIHVEEFQALNSSDVLSLVPLDPLDYDL
jgi:hypothetical protein